MSIVQVTFLGGASGDWFVRSFDTVCGEPLDPVERISMQEGGESAPTGVAWALRGVVSNLRYTTTGEADDLRVKQPPLGRSEASCAALISIRKSPSWWVLPQDERRAIYEEQSRHTSIGLEYLPRIARRLHHSRDLGEPFDFLTWFEFAPEHADAFDELVARLRSSEEWRYVDREIDIRLSRASSA